MYNPGVRFRTSAGDRACREVGSKPGVRVRSLGQTYVTDYGREEAAEARGAFGSQRMAGEGQLRRRKAVAGLHGDTLHFTLDFSQRNPKTFVVIEQ